MGKKLRELHTQLMKTTPDYVREYKALEDDFEQENAKMHSASNNKHLASMTDVEALRNAQNDPDSPPTDENFWADADVVIPQRKTS